MDWNKQPALIALVVVAIVAGVYITVYPSRQSAATLNGKALSLEIADTDQERYQGLSDRERICANCGMLFVFNDSRERNFVMRRMKFPLDIIWINRGVIEKIDANLSPESQEPYTLYSSGKPVNRVLELNAGAAQTYGLTVGQAL